MSLKYLEIKQHPGLSKWASKSNDRCLFKRETRKETEEENLRHTEKKECGDRGRDWSDVATDQASQRISEETEVSLLNSAGLKPTDILISDLWPPDL